MYRIVPPGWSAAVGESAIPGLPNLSRATVAGISVAISGNILISLALNCQKLAHRRLQHEHELRRERSHGADGTSGQNSKASAEAVQTVVEDDEDNELTPTNGRRPEQSNIHRDEELAGSSAMETEPLLPHGGDTETTLNRKPSFVPPWARRAEHGHPATTHTVMAVDIIAAKPTSGLDGSGPQKGGVKNDGTNEGDYLKSKLWWVL